MSNVNNNELLDKIAETVEWAHDLGEAWVGTTTGRVIDSQRELLRSVVKTNDFELAKLLLLDLIRTCKYAETALDEQ